MFDDNARDEGRAGGRSRRRSLALGTTLVAGGLLAGGLLTGSLTAYADTGSGTTSNSSSSIRSVADETPSPRGTGEALTGETADKVRAAALAANPGATVLRLESAADGTYRAYLQTSDGERKVVTVDSNFAVTGEQDCEERWGRGGSGTPDSSAESDAATTNI